MVGGHATDRKGSRIPLESWPSKVHNIRPNGSAADLPFGDGPIDLGGVRGWRDRTLIFDVLGLGWPPGAPGRAKLHVLRRAASF